jgi:hypothetical protein
MATHPVMAPGDANKVQGPRGASAAKAGGVSGAQSTALWCRLATIDPRSTISAMWASSIVWAAANLVDVVSTTVKNVKRPG